MNILLVDDNVSIISAMARGFKILGHVVYQAMDGLEAIKLVKEHRFDLVVSDVEMPQMDGPELVRWMLVNDPFAAKRTVLFSGRPEIVPQDIPVPIFAKGLYTPRELLHAACEQLRI